MQILLTQGQALKLSKTLKEITLTAKIEGGSYLRKEKAFFPHPQGKNPSLKIRQMYFVKNLWKINTYNKYVSIYPFSKIFIQDQASTTLEENFHFIQD